MVLTIIQSTLAMVGIVSLIGFLVPRIKKYIINRRLIARANKYTPWLGAVYEVKTQIPFLSKDAVTGEVYTAHGAPFQEYVEGMMCNIAKKQAPWFMDPYSFCGSCQFRECFGACVDDKVDRFEVNSAQLFKMLDKFRAYLISQSDYSQRRVRNSSHTNKRCIDLVRSGLGVEEEAALERLDLEDSSKPKPLEAIYIKEGRSKPVGY